MDNSSLLLGLLFLLGKGGLTRTTPTPPTSVPTKPPATPEGDKGWFAVWTGFHWVGPQHMTPVAAEALWRVEFDKALKDPKGNANLCKLYKYVIGVGWMQQAGLTATSNV